MSIGVSEVGLELDSFPRRIALFSCTATLAVLVEAGYAHLVPKIPRLYATLFRAAVWDCVLIAVLAAQVVDLGAFPTLRRHDAGHYLPLAVLFYYAIKIVISSVAEVYSKFGQSRSRSRHRAIVRRRVLVELAGGATGAQLLLGRVIFVVSGAGMAVVAKVLAWVVSGTSVLVGCIVVMFASHCAAGLAALDPRRTTPGRVVQWLCTGCHGKNAPLKIFGALLLLPFAVSVVAAQIWFRTVAFAVWFVTWFPCCRLAQGDSVYDAFEKEVVIPLLQCSFLGCACALAGMALNYRSFDPWQRLVVSAAATYYITMLMFWTTPAVLKAKVADEEGFEMSAGGYGDLEEEGQTALLRQGNNDGGEVELEDIQATVEELRALLKRERHDRSVEVHQLQETVRDQELVIRSSERKLMEAKKDSAASKEGFVRLSGEVAEWKARCAQLSAVGSHRVQSTQSAPLQDTPCARQVDVSDTAAADSALNRSHEVSEKCESKQSPSNEGQLTPESLEDSVAEPPTPAEGSHETSDQKAEAADSEPVDGDSGSDVRSWTDIPEPPWISIPESQADVERGLPASPPACDSATTQTGIVEVIDAGTEIDAGNVPVDPQSLGEEAQLGREASPLPSGETMVATLAPVENMEPGALVSDAAPEVSSGSE